MTLSANGAVDCDIHPAIPGMKSLLPYLDDYWREQVEVRAIDGLDMSLYPPRAALSGREDWRPKSGKPGSDFQMLQSQALDHFGSSLAICNIHYGVQAMFSADMAAAFCKAANDWLVEEWLNKDDRLRGSVLVPMNDPDLAVEEIERRAGDKRFVQVLMLAMSELPLGRRYFWPIYRAAAKHKLPIGIHAGSMYRHATTHVGWPSFRIEDYAAMSQAAQGQISSMITEGVFSAVPDLRVVIIECGVSWIPSFYWRAIAQWRAMRTEIPWVERSPAEIIRERFCFTAQPFDAPADAEGVNRLIDQIGSEDILLFASDYPHWQFDGDAILPAGISPALANKMKTENPYRTYPRLVET